MNHCQGSVKYPNCRVKNKRPHPVTDEFVSLTVIFVKDKNFKDSSLIGELKALCNRCADSYSTPTNSIKSKIVKSNKGVQMSLIGLSYMTTTQKKKIDK